jgi:hypothetical protein
LYLKCDDVTYDYNSNDSVKYNVGFTCDYMTSVFPKKAALAAVQKGAISVATGMGSSIGQNKFVNNMIKGK